MKGQIAGQSSDAAARIDVPDSFGLLVMNAPGLLLAGR
jgi:hypothetical protein